MTDQPQIDIDAINERLNSVSERARIKREEEDKRRAEEEARLAQEREDRLITTAAQLRDQFYERFNQVDVTDANSTESAIALFEQCMQVLSGEQPSLAPTSNPTPVVTSDIPFDWGKMDADQRESILLIAAKKKRFYVKPSGALVDKKGRELNLAHAATNQPPAVLEEPAQPATSEDNDTGAPAPESESTPTPTPTTAPAKKATAKKVAALVPPPAAEPAPVSEPEPAPDATDDQPKGWRAKAAAVGKKAFSAVD